MTTATLRKSGNSVMIAIPKETRARLGFDPGQKVSLIEEPDGLKITKLDPELDRQLEIARSVLNSEFAVLRALAKK